jgi:nitrous oxidase accessory protein
MLSLVVAVVGCTGSGTSLAQALAQARSGEVIELCGTQSGAISIPDGVAVVGRRGAVIDGRGADVVVAMHGHARLENVTVTGDGGRLDRDGAAIRLDGNGGVLRNVRVRAAAFGIYLAQAQGAKIVDCEVTGLPNREPSQRGNGIHLWNSRANRIERCRIRDTRDGFYLSFAHRNLIADNEVEHTRFGIHYMYSDENRVVDNRLHDNIAGAALMFSKNNVFEDNRAEHNTRHGLLFKDVDSSMIRGNLVRGNGRGFFIQQSSGNQVAHNRVTDNVIGVHISAAASENVFADNLLAHNVQQVLMHGARDNRWDGNYWSDYTGADANGDGLGDTEYHAGDLAGYLADAYPLVRILEAGPAYDAIRLAETAFPVIDFPGVVDHHPLMRPPQ